MKIEEFVARLNPNKHALDDEYEQQPELFYRVSHMHARACADRDNSRLELEVLETGLFNKFREEANASSNGRVTDTSIRNKIADMKDVKRLRATYIKAKLRAEELTPLKEAYTQRGHSIRGLADLFLANYYQSDSGGRIRTALAGVKAEENKEKVNKLRRKQRDEET